MYEVTEPADAVKANDATPLSATSLTKYATFRTCAHDAIEASKGAGHTALAAAIEALLPVADFRVQSAAGDDSQWEIRSAVREVIDEARKSLDALNRVAPDTSDSETAKALLSLKDEFTKMVEDGDAVMEAFRNDERQNNPHCCY